MAEVEQFTEMAEVEQFTEMAWIQFLGIEPVSADAGAAVIRLDPAPAHLNHNGTVNAAVLFGLAEVAGAGALVAGMLEEVSNSYVVVRRASIEYEAPARGEMTAEGRLDTAAFVSAIEQVRRGVGIETNVPVAITDGGGTRVCSAEFTVAVRPRRTQSEGDTGS